MITLKDSGKRKEASTGAVRDASEGKTQMFYLSPHVMPCPVMGQFLLDRDLAGLYKLFNALVKDVGWKRLCDHLDAGAAKYDSHNWQKGMNLSWVVSSYLRHYVQWTNGETDEDHAAARLCNLLFMIHYVEELEAGRLPAELDDMPKYAAVVMDSESDWQTCRDFTDGGIAQSEVVEEYIKRLPWSPDASDHLKTMVEGNLRTFHQHLFKDTAHNTEGTK